MEEKKIQGEIRITLFEGGRLEVSLPNNLVVALGMWKYAERIIESKISAPMSGKLVEPVNFHIPPGIPRG